MTSQSTATTHFPLPHFGSKNPEYPLEAYRDAIVNAILHRDFFDASGDVVIEVHKNNLQITNPGGLVKGLDRSNFGKLSRPRNRLMADLLLRTEFVERLGTGIARIRDACEMAGLPAPEFEFNDYNFFITINGPKVEIGVVGEAAGVPVNVPVNQRQRWILSMIMESGSIQMRAIRNRFRYLSEKTSKRDIEQLRELGLIVFEGAPKTGRYILTDKGKRIFKMI